MKKIFINLFVVSIVIGAAAIVSSAQSNSKIVKFAKGKSSAVETFTLNGDDGINYILKVKKWNLLNATVTGSYTDGVDAQGLEIKLTKMGSEKILSTVSPGEEIEHQFDSDGDYEITVMNHGPRKAKIKLNVTLGRD